VTKGLQESIHDFERSTRRSSCSRSWTTWSPARRSTWRPATFRRVAEQLYPVPSCSQEPPDSLDRLDLDQEAIAELRSARDRALGGGWTDDRVEP
jgi:hypothetical protein